MSCKVLKPSTDFTCYTYYIYVCTGREFRALFVSTSEPTKRNGSTKNPTKSLTDRFVFNTALTRAQSLVVSFGNPFLLLKMEEFMVKRYGEKGKCWSNYLKCCLENNTVHFSNYLKLSSTQEESCISNLRELVDKQLGLLPCSPIYNSLHPPEQLDPPTFQGPVITNDAGINPQGVNPHQQEQQSAIGGSSSHIPPEESESKLKLIQY